MYSLKALFNASKIWYLTDNIYYYRQNPESIMNTNHGSGLKLADRLLLNVDSINFAFSFLEFDVEFRDKLIYAHIWALKKFRKRIFLLSIKARNLLYKRVQSLKIDFTISLKYLLWHEKLFYNSPKLIMFIFAFISPFLRFIKLLKFKLQQ